MAHIVLVHGIAQEQKSGDTLESEWMPNIAGGLRTAGFPELADRVWRSARPGDIDTRMAFYGDLFRTPDQQGGWDDIESGQQSLAEDIALEWLRRAANRSSHETDRIEAKREITNLTGNPGEVQGARAALRPTLATLARLRPFARYGMAFAERFIVKALRQVTLYLTNDTVRDHVQERVATLIGPDTRVIVAHSLGSVVAYETLHRLGQPLPLLVTLGSPLGLRTIVYERLRPQPPAVPLHLRRWVNIADPDDLVAADPDLARHFPGADGILDSHYTVDNGARPHEASFYLTKPETGHPIGEALTDP